MRGFTRLTVVATALVGSAWAAADTLESVEKAITDKVAKLNSYSMKNTFKQDMETAEYSNKAEGHSTLEAQKSGEVWLFRMEGTQKMTMKMGGQETKNDGTSLMVCDGKFNWFLSENNGQKMCMKSKADKMTNIITKEYFDEMRKTHDVKLGADESVDGKSCWTIEFSAKEPTPGGPNVMIMNFDKDTGLNLKMVGKDDKGKVIMTSSTTDVKVNPSIAADRFTFKVPEGVQVQDMTQMGDSAGAGDSGAAKAEEPKKEEPKKEEPKEEPKKEDKKPKLPKLPKP